MNTVVPFAEGALSFFLEIPLIGQALSRCAKRQNDCFSQRNCFILRLAGDSETGIDRDGDGIRLRRIAIFILDNTV